MTAIGKILAIIVLLFSVVVAGFIIILYAKGTNWAVAAKQWQDRAQASDASREAAVKELENEKVAISARLAEKDAKIKELEGKVTLLEGPTGPAATRLKELEEYKKASNPKDAELLAVKNELQKRANEIGELEKQVKDKDTALIAATTAKNDEIAKRIASDINATSYKNKAEGLEKRVRETEMKLARNEARGNSTGTNGGTSVVALGNPAPRVEGVVTDLRDDLLEISIGSDSGLEKDHILDVYRLKPTPLFLGQIRLKDVRAKDAVGVFVDKPKGRVQKGDLVSNDVYSRN
jgi:hypothetical protein